ncbi:MAG: DUF302 domain-containing protein [Candidatus Cloacimonadales bacterium]
MINYGFYKELNCSFSEAAELILPLISKHNFSIVTQIDLKEKFSEKLGITYPQYTILGLCNPKLAHKAISVEPDAGLFLPCNMVVYEKGDRVAVGIMKPSQMMDMIENEKIGAVISEVEDHLKQLFAEIELTHSQSEL